MKSYIPIIMLSVLLFWSVVNAGPFTEAKNISMYTDIKAHNIGDIITVIISENARASNEATVTANKSTSSSIEGGPGIGGFDFFGAFGMSGSNDSEFDGEGSVEKYGSLSARMTVRVIGINPNGDLIIEGSRIININSDQETLFLSGIIREKDISPSNSIFSFQIADAEISYKGKGQTHEAARPGIFTRIVNWIF